VAGVRPAAAGLASDAVGAADVLACVGVASNVIPRAKIAKIPKIPKAVQKAYKAYDAFKLKLAWAKAILKKADDAAAATADAGKAGESCSINSFLPGTSVLMADGTDKAIETLQVGDQVLATDPEAGTTSAKPVTTTIEGTGDKHLVEITVASGDGTAAFTATGNHPIWVADQQAWRDASEVRAGGELLSSDGARVRVLAIVAYWAPATVHNLTVEDVHTFYVLAGHTPVLTHNCGSGLLDDAHEAVGDPNAKGGVYALVSRGSGKVMRTGHAVNLVSRKSNHFKEFPDLKFVVLYRADDYEVRRGLEEIVENRYTPMLRNNRAIDITKKFDKRTAYIAAARA
jgi:Pretoxin HINT domain